jgi:hypothetical protein
VASTSEKIEAILPPASLLIAARSTTAKGEKLKGKRKLEKMARMNYSLISLSIIFLIVSSLDFKNSKLTFSP